MISKSRIGRRVKRKNHPEIAETLLVAKKNDKWVKISQKISGSRRNYSSVNLSKIDSETKEGDTVLIIGRVLGTGNITKKVRICAFGFSESAREKIKSVKGEISTVLEEIKKNPKAEGVKVLE